MTTATITSSTVPVSIGASPTDGAAATVTFTAVPTAAPQPHLTVSKS